MLTQRSLNQDCRVQLLYICSYTQCWHRVKLSQRVATLEEVVRVSLVEGPANQQHNLHTLTTVSLDQQEAVALIVLLTLSIM